MPGCLHNTFPTSNATEHKDHRKSRGDSARGWELCGLVFENGPSAGTQLMDARRVTASRLIPSVRQSVQPVSSSKIVGLSFNGLCRINPAKVAFNYQIFDESGQKHIWTFVTQLYRNIMSSLHTKGLPELGFSSTPGATGHASGYERNIDRRKTTGVQTLNQVRF